MLLFDPKPSPHPLAALSLEEVKVARDVVLAASPGELIQFRMIYTQEPEKSKLVAFLELEHAGALTPSSPRPPRLARVHYAATGKSPDRKACEIEVSVDLTTRKVASKDVIGTEFLAGLST